MFITASILGTSGEGPTWAGAAPPNLPAGELTRLCGRPLTPVGDGPDQAS